MDPGSSIDSNGIESGADEPVEGEGLSFGPVGRPVPPPDDSVELLSVDEAVRLSFPDATREEIAAYTHLLGRWFSYRDAAANGRDPMASALARLMLYREGGATRILTDPPAYDGPLFERLQVLDRLQRDDGAPEDRLRALVDAIAACSERDGPLRAWLSTELAKLLLAERAAGASHPELSAPWVYAASAAEAAAGLEGFPRDLLLDIFAVAGASADAYTGADRSEVLSDALRYARRCVDVAYTHPSDPVLIGMARHNLAARLANSDDLDALHEARQLLNQALAIQDEHFGSGHGLVISTVGSLMSVMRVLAERGETHLHEESIQVGERYWPSDSVARTVDPRLLAPLAGSLGAAYKDRLAGDDTVNTDRAIRFNERALELTERAFGPYSPNTIGAMLNLAQTYHLADEKRNRDRVERASEIAAEAVSRAKYSELDEDPLWKAYLLGSLANIMADNARNTDDWNEAIRIQRDIVLSLESTQGCPLQDLYDARMNLALSLRSLHLDDSSEGAALDEAIQILSDLRRDLQRAGGVEQSLIDVSTHLVSARLAHVRSAGGSLSSDPETLGLLGEVADLLEKGPDPRRSLGAARTIGYELADLGDNEYAARFSGIGAAAATSWYARAASVETRTQIVVESGGMAIEAAWHIARTGQIDKAAGVLDEAKARWIRHKFNLDRIALYELETLDPDLAAALTSAVRGVELIERRELQSPSSLGPRLAWPPATESDMDRTEKAEQANQALTTVVDRIRSAHPGLLDNSGESPAPLNVPVVHIAVANHGTLAIIAWPDGSFTHIEDASVSHDDLARIAQRCDLQRRAGDHRTLSACWETEFGVLSSLVEELTGHLQGRGFESVVLVPSGGLATAPVHRIGAGALDDTFAVSIAPARWLLAQRQSLALNERSDLPATYLGVADTNQLHFAEAEVAGSAAYFSTSTQRPASEVAVDQIKRELSGGGLLHIACHGSYDEMNPADSSIELRQPMRLADLVRANHSPNGCIAIVAACESAATHRLADEGIGISSMLHFAGASSVLGCLWEVNDLLCCIVVTRFSKEIASGARPAEALRKSKAWITSATTKDLADWLLGITKTLDAESVAYRRLHDKIREMCADELEGPAFSSADVLPFVIVGHP